MIRCVAGAFAFGTVAPMRVDTPLGRGSMAAFPLVGLVLGLVAAGVALGGRALFGPDSLLAGLLAVTALALLTRGLHLDGLADTADGLGCYGSAEKARRVMRDGSAGPFGVAAVTLSLMLTAGAFTALPAAQIVVAVTAGRVAALAACARGVPSAPGSSLGALVAGSQPIAVVTGWVLAVTVAAGFLTTSPWHGPVAVLAALAVTGLLVAHCVRRFGGVSGDVLGAAVEAATVLTALGLAAG